MISSCIFRESRDNGGLLASIPVAFVVLLILLLPHVATGKPPSHRPGPPPTVVVEPARQREVNPVRKYVGHVEAIQYVDILPRVEGYLERVNFKEGQYVEEGDLLYVIEQPPYLSRVKLWEAQVMEAKAALYKAKMHLKRLRAARPESVPATKMDNAVAERKMAEARLKETKAQLELAKIDLGYTEIKAPISGLLGKAFFTKGNLVGPRRGPLARLIQVEPIRVVYSISERDLVELQKTMKEEIELEGFSSLKVRIRLPNGEMYPETGRVEFIDNRVDPSTGSIAVRAVFQNSNRLLTPGEYVDVLVSRPEAEKMLVIPQGAVLMDLKGHYVLVVDEEGRVKQVRVKLGSQTGTLWAVRSGLFPGALVVVQGIQKIKPGEVVKAVIQGEER